ncbi:MAG TPA: MBL fold metallo-hydrolase [Candidatus Acidoferrales bacterium]|nr:MBL fold metallo-hydrolase [Candidatus Acidoferrales bacterium]
MKVHVLGCGDAFGSGGRNQSGYLVAARDRLFLIDCGPTSLLALKRAGFSPAALDAVFISHLHGDHFGGLPFFFIDALYANARPKPLIIAGPAGTEPRARALFDIMYGAGPEPKALPPTVFHVLHPEQSATIVGIEVFPFAVPHQARGTPLGLKFAYEGKQILFSGDASWTELFVRHARGVDLFLCECCFFAEESATHMSYKTLARNLSRLECKRLILTHLGEEMLARRAELAVESAYDGMIIEL